MRRAMLLLCAALTALSAGAAWSAEYPTRSIRLIVPFAPGGGTDLLARLFVPRLSELLGQQVVVDNRGGAGSVVGTELVARSTPDGYTLGFFDTAFTINSVVVPTLPYSSEKDFSILTIVATSPTVMVVRASLPVKTLADFIAIAKSNPGKLTYGSAGPSSSAHLTGEMFKAAAGIDVRHIPFKGAGAAITDLVGGHIDMTWAVPGSIAAHVKAGTVRALATSGSKRVATMPNVPTFESLGLPSVNPGNFRFLTSPSAVPRAVQARLVAAMEKISQMPDLATRMAENGYDPVFIGPPASREYVLTEMRKWRRVIQESGLKVN